MRRRDVLRSLLVAAPLGLGGCLGDLPGATGPRGPPEPAEPSPSAGGEPTVADLDVEPTDDELLRVVATVRNPRDATVTPTVVVRVTVGGEEFVRRTPVEVPARDEADATLDFDVTFADFSANGNVSASLE
jgi:hypothetical protein